MNAVVLVGCNDFLEPPRFQTGQHTVMVGSPEAEADAELIALIAGERDRAAFARLFDRFAPRVKALLMRLGSSPGVAEEIAQETLLTVWRKAAQFDPGRATASSWIFAIARNRRIDLLRGGIVLQPVAELPDRASEDPDSEAIVASTERARLVRLALATLPPEQSEVVRLAYFDDRPHGDIERLLGIPLGTVKSRLRLAMAKLRSLLDSES
jgi:RNA polymerase sigma-70 factor (ECF subfamily)